MSEETTTKVSTAFWVIAGLLAVWNLSGLYMYYQMSITTPEQLQAAGYSVVQIEHILGTPAWAHSAYAIAVNAGVLGVIFLLLRKAWAIPMFVLSLIGALLQDLDAYVLRGALEHFEAEAALPGALFAVWCILTAAGATAYLRRRQIPATV